ncbi:MAG: hypothetical protein A2Y17_12180 [Clostridiales bacterium GWF2_38_85]|nr:MAG: hypothetical protein A2Y17_12180 [Clostridiales bacterium GWF2_38_85]
MKPVKCPECGHEFIPERDEPKLGTWTTQEDEQLLHSYQAERKLIREIADELGRTQDATRNRLYELRGAGKAKAVSVAVQMTSKEYDEMRAARDNLKAAKAAERQLKNTEAELASLYSAVSELISAKRNHKNTAPQYDKLSELAETYYGGVFEEAAI